MIQLLLILLLIHLMSPAISTSLDIKFDLTHVDYGSQFTKLELIQRAAFRSKARTAWLSSLSTTNSHLNTGADVFVYPSGGGEYVIDLAIGTPPRPYSAILDTGSDLIWTQCSPCRRCIQQPAPLFDPSKSSTFSTLPCSSKLCQAFGSDSYNCSSRYDQCIYHYSYGDATSSRGVLGSETFTFGSAKKVRIPHIGFGCGRLNAGDLNNGSGIVGFGRGPLSLVSQLGVPKFAYCLTYFGGTEKSSLLLGSVADQYKTTLGPVQSTAMLQNPRVPIVYYVTLEGITVGKKRLNIPKSAFVIDKNLNGGVIIDSGTGFTQLVGVAFDQVKKAFISYMKLPVVTNYSIFDLCFKKPSAHVEVPKLVYHFAGADMDLPRQNYIVEDEENNLICLLVKSMEGLNIIGNFQQQNFQIVYDVENKKISFAPAQCDQV